MSERTSIKMKVKDDNIHTLIARSTSTRLFCSDDDNQLISSSFALIALAHIIIIINVQRGNKAEDDV